MKNLQEVQTELILRGYEADLVFDPIVEEYISEFLKTALKFKRKLFKTKPGKIAKNLSNKIVYHHKFPDLKNIIYKIVS